VYFEEPDISFNGDLIINMLDMYGQSSTFATDLAVNALQGEWQGGVPLLSYQQHYNPESGNLKRLDIRIELPGVNAAEVRNL
jgi:hypothetical protein